MARRRVPDVKSLSDDALSDLLACCRDERRRRLGARLADIEHVVVGGRLVAVVGLQVQRWEARGEYGWEPTGVYLAASPGQAWCETVDAETSLPPEEYAAAVRAVSELWDLEGACARPGAVTWRNDRVPGDQVLTFFETGQPA